MVKQIIQHPIKTIATIGITSAALCALPFLGISVATGGAILTTIFGIGTVYGALKNMFSYFKNKHNNNNDGQRKAMYNIGGSFFDLALLTPILKGAVNQAKVNFQIGTKKLLQVTKDSSGKVVQTIDSYYGGERLINYSNGKPVKIITNSLWNKIKHAKTWKDKFNFLFEQDAREAFFLKVNKAYVQTAKERGFIHPHGVTMVTEPIRLSPKGRNYIAGYVSPELIKEEGVHCNQMLLRKTNRSLGEIAKFIGHEHRHYEQYSMMARLEELKSDFSKILNLTRHKGGIIKRGTKEAELAQKFYEAHKNYVAPEKNYQAYRNNLLETDARAVGETEVAGQLLANLRKVLGVKEKEGYTLTYNPAMDLTAANALIINKQAKNTYKQSA